MKAILQLFPTSIKMARAATPPFSPEASIKFSYLEL